MRRLSYIAIGIFMQWILCCIVQICIHEVDMNRNSNLYVQSFTPHHIQKLQLGYTKLMISTSSSNDNNNDDAANDIDISNINEAQLLLACRSWLLRKHKLEWKEKKRRADAASSPLNNEGYFWPDPNDLLYLREDPDPYNLNYNETYAEYYGYKRNGVRLLTSQDTTYSGKNYLVDEIIHPQVEERASTSTNPFSTNPLYPSDEHIRRSNAKMKLWNNETWKQEWYSKRWEGKVATDEQKLQDKHDKLLRTIPNDIIESESFEEMSETNVTSAIISYLVGNQRKSESRKSNKDKRQIEREAFREWREQVKKEACGGSKPTEKMTMVELQAKLKKAAAARFVDPFESSLARKITASNNIRPSSNHELSFSPSIRTMKKLKKVRSEKSAMAYQTRLANSKETNTSPSKNITKFYNFNEPEILVGELTPVQAMLNIGAALDQNKIPSPIDVEIILQPGRLGRRRDTLRRILNECFGLRGKVVPSGIDNEEDSELLFTTKCTIDQLGQFVLSMMSSTGRVAHKYEHYEEKF